MIIIIIFLISQFRYFSTKKFPSSLKIENFILNMATTFDPSACELTRPNETRYVLFPIEHPHLYQLYKQHQSVIWTADEIDYSKDRASFLKLDPPVQRYLTWVLAFFAASDGVVMENLASKFFSEVQLAEARSFYATQLYMEQIHSETYSLLIDTYITDPAEKMRVLGAANSIDTVGAKVKWAERWMDSDRPFPQRLIAFAVVEGVFFSGAFCSIFYLKRFDLPGLSFSNELIARDESLHTEFAVTCYNTYCKGSVSEHTVTELVREAVELETSFIRDALPVTLIGMDADSMTEYIKFVADRLMLQLGFAAIYGCQNPFPFMDAIGVRPKSNFFETRVGEYAKPASREIDFDAAAGSEF